MPLLSFPEATPTTLLVVSDGSSTLLVVSDGSTTLLVVSDGSIVRRFLELQQPLRWSRSVASLCRLLTHRLYNPF